MIKLKDIILEAESFSAINKSTGKVSVFKTKDARDSAIKGGTHDKKAEKGGDSSAGKKDTPKVNIFDKPEKKDAPKKDDEILVIYRNKRGTNKTKSFTDKKSAQKFADANDGELGKIVNGRLKSFPKTSVISKGEEPNVNEPKSEPSKPRPGNPKVNKEVRKITQDLGFTPQKLGKEEYESKMAKAAIEALTDSNFSSEARKLISILEDNPEFAKNPNKDPNKPKDMFSPEYDEWRKNSVYGSTFYDTDDDIDKVAHMASNEAGFAGEEAVDAIAHDLKMNGSHKLAAKIQSIFDEKNESSASLRDLLPEGLITEAEQPLGYKTKFAQPIIDIKGKGVSHKIEFTLTVGPNSDSFGWIVLDFIPKGKKMLDLYNSNPTSVDQVAKWVTSKIKLPTDTRYQPKNRCRVLVNTNSILKKLK